MFVQNIMENTVDVSVTLPPHFTAVILFHMIKKELQNFTQILKIQKF